VDRTAALVSAHTHLVRAAGGRPRASLARDAVYTITLSMLAFMCFMFFMVNAL
jgi:hypothetical protein